MAEEGKLKLLGALEVLADRLGAVAEEGVGPTAVGAAVGRAGGCERDSWLEGGELWLEGCSLLLHQCLHFLSCLHFIFKHPHPEITSN